MVSTDPPESERRQRGLHQVLHQDIGSILGANRTHLEHGEARLHPKDEHRADQHPHDVQIAVNGRVHGVSRGDGNPGGKVRGVEAQLLLEIDSIIWVEAHIRAQRGGGQGH